MTMGQLKILIPLTWLFAFVVSFPTLMEYSVNAIRTTHGNDTHEQLSCGSQRVSRVFSILNAIFVTIVSYSIPVIFMFKNYLQVALFVLRQGRLIRDNSGSNGQKLKRFQNRIRLVKLLVLVAVVFAVSWLPFFIILLYAVSISVLHSMNIFPLYKGNYRLYAFPIIWKMMSCFRRHHQGSGFFYFW